MDAAPTRSNLNQIQGPLFALSNQFGARRILVAVTGADAGCLGRKDIDKDEQNTPENGMRRGGTLCACRARGMFPAAAGKHSGGTTLLSGRRSGCRADPAAAARGGDDSKAACDRRANGLAAWTLALHRHLQRSMELAARALCPGAAGCKNLGPRPVGTLHRRWLDLARGPLGLNTPERAAWSDPRVDGPGAGARILLSSAPQFDKVPMP